MAKENFPQEKETPKIMRRSLPQILDEMDDNTRAAVEAARRAEEAARTAGAAAGAAAKASEAAAVAAQEAAGLTVKELKVTIEEMIEAKLLELLGDPDQGLELREEVVARLKRSAEAGEATIPVDEVARRLGLK